MPILALYYEQSLFSAQNVAIIYAVEAITIAIFELPTGIIADKFGRRKTMILDGIITLFSLYFLFLGGNMFNFVVAAILQAIGLSLSSGAENALIYDSLKAANREREYKKVIGIYYGIWELGAALAAIVGAYLATISLQTPVLYTFIPYAIGAILICFLIEPSYHKGQDKFFLHLKKSCKIVLTSRTLMLLLIATALFFGMDATLHNLKPLFLEFKQVPLIYFGYIYFFTFGLASLGFVCSHYVSKKIGDKNTAIIFTVLIIACLFTATFLNGVFAAIFVTIPAFFFGIKKPAIEHMIQQRAPSSKRATIMSLLSLTSQFSLAVFSPLVGLVADLYTINFSQQIFCGFLLITPVLYLFMIEKAEAETK